MEDIHSRVDVILLVDTFYGKVKQSDVIGHIFNTVAKVDWTKHLPVMYSFWSSILLAEHTYTGNPMIKHIALSDTYPLSEDHFREWLTLFHQTIDELFKGDKANEAKSRASTIAGMMLHKIKRVL